MTLTKALKNLYYAITGEAAGKNSCVKVINELADNWPEEFTKAEAELPAVTASNNGAVLKVSDGAWAIGSETTELPASAAADVGKVLTVGADGTPEWAAIPEPEETPAETTT